MERNRTNRMEENRARKERINMCNKRSGFALEREAKGERGRKKENGETEMGEKFYQPFYGTPCSISKSEK